METDRLRAGLETAIERLLAEQRPGGYWEGRLSSSALATATAVTALATTEPQRHERLIRAGLTWLAGDQNADGGWGDSPECPSNLPTTMLVLGAFAAAGAKHRPGIVVRAEEYVRRQAGRTTDERIRAIIRTYGADRTFAVPILTQGAVAGLVPWKRIPRLPFELSVLPHGFYAFLRLHVVSYALPALIAVGLALHEQNPSRHAAVRWLRHLAARPALRKLAAIQPSNGGFLEATPLTSFVAMSLAAAGRKDHPVARRCVEFLADSVRPDGSWPIDTNLSTWVTTNALLALDAAGALDRIDAGGVVTWLVAQQYRRVHPYTHAAPGGWAWTPLPGGVPDSDDTARAILALMRIRRPASGRGAKKRAPARTDAHFAPAVTQAVRWLLRLQNRDGGWPTFCRGWGKLPFDRSSPDLAAHVLQALHAAAGHPPPRLLKRSLQLGIAYLQATQRPDGAWVPLWFGNPLSPEERNPVFGTAHVLPALFEVGEQPCAERGVRYLLSAQGADGGWGGEAGVAPSVEETAAAVSALAQAPASSETARAVARGVEHLLDRIENGSWTTAAPIGLYFSNLWYSERLYPIIWILEALGRVLARTATPDD